MKLSTAWSLLTIALSVATSSSRADEKPAASISARRFEALKMLSGDWVQAGKDGKASDTVISSIRVTSAGTAVQETLFPGSDHEMVTMYHLDGDDLVLTHYCAQGNQPRLRAEPGTDVHKIVFKFVSATNLKSDADPHINGANLTLLGSDHFKAEWLFCKDGKSCHEVDLNLVRKRK